MARTSLIRKALGMLVLGIALALPSLQLGQGVAPQIAHAGNNQVGSGQPGPAVAGSWRNFDAGARLFDLEIADTTQSPNAGSTAGETITYSVNVFANDARHSLLATGVSRPVPFDAAGTAVVTLRSVAPTTVPLRVRTVTTLTLVRLPDSPNGAAGHVLESLAVVIHDRSLVLGDRSSVEVMY